MTCDQLKPLIEVFKKNINALTVRNKGDAEIRDFIKLRHTRSFIAKDQGYLVPKKSIFNKIIEDSHFELLFANFLENCHDVVSYTKNYWAKNLKPDYVNIDGDISSYYPDFIVKLSDNQVVTLETKELEDLDVSLKTALLKQWCDDINCIQSNVKYDSIYLDMGNFEKYNPVSFKQLADIFREYKEPRFMF